MKRWIKILIGFLIIIGIFTLTFLYALFIGTKGLKVKEYKIEVSNLEPEYHGLKIVHLSDIHYGSIINKKELKNIVEKVNSIKPDIVVLTGDISTDGLNNKQLEEVSNLLSKINANIGKYIIKGNHDYKFDKWDILVENSGFTDLNDNYELIYISQTKPILLAGISTNLYGTLNIKDKIKPINDYLNNQEQNNSNYNILLIHEPDFIEEIDYNKFNLILSGHSHNGQVRLPFFGAIYTPIGAKKYYDEYYHLNNSELYISSGLGTTDLNVRLFNHPSFNLYRIVSKD